MSKQFRLDRHIGFQNTFYTKCINPIIESIGPSIILRSIYTWQKKETYQVELFNSQEDYKWWVRFAFISAKVY